MDEGNNAKTGSDIKEGGKRGSNNAEDDRRENDKDDNDVNNLDDYEDAGAGDGSKGVNVAKETKADEETNGVERDPEVDADEVDEEEEDSEPEREKSKETEENKMVVSKEYDDYDGKEEESSSDKDR